MPDQSSTCFWHATATHLRWRSMAANTRLKSSITMHRSIPLKDGTPHSLSSSSKLGAMYHPPSFRLLYGPETAILRPHTQADMFKQYCNALIKHPHTSSALQAPCRKDAEAQRRQTMHFFMHLHTSEVFPTVISMTAFLFGMAKVHHKAKSEKDLRWRESEAPCNDVCSRCASEAGDQSI
jgi:hypothetical protein